MKTIWKYTLAITDQQPLNLPVGARILCVQAQHEYPQLWALIDTDVGMNRQHIINMYGTGHVISRDPGRYLGTFQIQHGGLVFHCFEEEA